MSDQDETGRTSEQQGVWVGMLESVAQAHALGQMMGGLMGAIDGASETPISTDSAELGMGLTLAHAFLDGFTMRLPEVAEASAPRWPLTGQMFQAMSNLHDLLAPMEAGMRDIQLRTALMSGVLAERIVIERDEDSLSFGSTTSAALDENLLRASMGEFDDKETGEQHRMRRLRFVDLFPKDYEPLDDIGVTCDHEGSDSGAEGAGGDSAADAD